MKRFAISLWLLIVLFVIGVVLWDVTTNNSKFLSAHVYPLFIKNKLTIDYGVLNAEDFKVYFTGYAEGSDRNSSYNNELIHTAKDIPFIYGKNDWIITYKNQQQCKFSHFKTNKRYIHNYKFIIYKKQDILYCNVNIQGQNELEDTFCFSPFAPLK